MHINPYTQGSMVHAPQCLIPRTHDPKTTYIQHLPPPAIKPHVHFVDQTPPLHSTTLVPVQYQYVTPRGPSTLPSCWAGKLLWLTRLWSPISCILNIYSSILCTKSTRPFCGPVQHAVFSSILVLYWKLHICRLWYKFKIFFLKDLLVILIAVLWKKSVQ
jgi:hypothetical protein